MFLYNLTMNKVYLIHGYGGWPNGAWRTSVIKALEQKEVYACALPMPSSEDLILNDWIEEIRRVVKRDKNHKVFLIGHSLGSTTILRFLEKHNLKVEGVILVSCLIKPVENKAIGLFVSEPFDFEKIKHKSKNFVVIHGKNDSRVPFEQGKVLASKLDCELIGIENGGHLTGSEGWKEFPQVIQVLEEMGCF